MSSTHASTVHASPSSQSTTDTKRQPNSSAQAHSPTQRAPTAQSSGVVHDVGGSGMQPTAGKQISPPSQSASCGVWSQNIASRQKSSVHGIASRHSSSAVHGSGASAQPIEGSQTSPASQQSAHGSCSHTPATQWSMLQAMRSAQ